ncbi:asparagine synthase (glutamine-hydrolyzing) [Patescibacteria group bacterium AH-259-L05]|nr:asparagine synthase (glutamine-hydrolyzing) [Patescibacteria group bacterium AH-259-L05]
MCGIIGKINLDGKKVSAENIEKMRDTMIHRGPDDKGIYINANVGLGHRRLSIIDLTELGRQPMTNEDKTLWLVYNGEIYNFKELKKILENKGHTFISNTDSEVILHAYEQWKEKCLDKFNGMFAFAIWDEKNKKLFLARDRYGIKPLYYYFKNNTFIFASEIKAILEDPRVKAAVCAPALLEYFTFQNIFSDKTLFSNIRLLPPGTFATIKSNDGKSFQQVTYWDYRFEEPSHPLSEQEYIQELDRLFAQAVKRQLMSDVPVGSYLSGGMDSGSITSVAGRHLPHLCTFTCGFDLSSASGLELGFDERKKAEALSYLYKTEHYEVVLKAGDMERVMEKLIWHLEDLRVGQCYPNYYVARLASNFVKVVLSGAGGDELFAGYPWRYYKAAASHDSNQYIEKYYHYWQRLVPENALSRFFKPETLEQIKKYSTFDVFKNVIKQQKEKVYAPEDHINKSLYFEIKTFLHGLFVVEDKLSMAHSLESRVPFMDNDLVEFAMKIPVKLKLRNLNKVIKADENELQRYLTRTRDGKIILRKAMSRYVPSHITNQIKQGFSAPDATWFRGESIDYISDLLLNKNAKIYNYFQPTFVENIINEHVSGKTNHRLFIWSLLCFEHWNKIFIDKKSTF